MTSPKGRILCTEDDADTRELLIYILNMAGYEVICTDNPHQALDMIKAERFDLCIMDNWLPGLSGEDLCKKIREFDSKTPSFSIQVRLTIQIRNVLSVRVLRATSSSQ